MADEITLISKIDKGLEEYYTKLGRKDYKDDGVGKFAFFAEESGFEDDGIEDELKQPADESTILEFDDDFPFSSSIDADDEDARNTEIHRILNDIAKYGAPRDALETMELEVDICHNVNQDTLQETTDQYTAQMESLKTLKGGDGDLQYFLAVGNQQNYPFLSYMVDSYTKDNADHHYKMMAKKKAQKPGDFNIYTPYTVTSWLEKQNFFRAIHRKYPQKADQLKSAMRNYTNRIMARLKFTPTFKIDDDLSQCVQYVVAMPRFIHRLMASTARPPFQVDLVIAVRGVASQVGDDNRESSDDEDDEDPSPFPAMDPRKDHVGYVQDEFKKMNPPIYYAPHNEFAFAAADDDDEKKESAVQTTQGRTIEGIARVLGERFQEFRTVLNGEAPDGVDKKDYKRNKSDKYEPQSYPSRRRFSFFVDRRKNKPTKGDAGEDELTVFEPPDDCNTIPDNHVHEIGFALLSRCVLPRHADKQKHVTSKDAMCGQLLTFMFNVESSDEVKCYVIWCGQTMRFHGDHIWKILPFIFEQNKANEDFLKNEGTQSLKDMFDEIYDRKFAKFYLALKHFGK
eukprot:261587_1